MGVAAVEGLLNGETDVMVGIRNNKMVYNKFDAVMSSPHEIDNDALRIAKILSI
jgi:6-phosphofructokinase 1